MNNPSDALYALILILICVAVIVVFIICPIVVAIYNIVCKKALNKLDRDALSELGLQNWQHLYADDEVCLASSRSVYSYTIYDYFKKSSLSVDDVKSRLADKRAYFDMLIKWLNDNDLTERFLWSKYKMHIYSEYDDMKYIDTYVVRVYYSSPTGRSEHESFLCITEDDISEIENDPSLIMSKSEYNQYIKEQNKSMLDEKRHSAYEIVNAIIDSANNSRDTLIINKDKIELDRLITQLFDKVVRNIDRIKSVDSEEWGVLGSIASDIKHNVDSILSDNKFIVDYYASDEFRQVKSACESLMSTQREFNEYIDEKVQSISKLFGQRVVRNETVHVDKYNYVRPYTKNITPFTAEVSATVFSSAENNPMDYIVKYFYPNKDQYPEQIQKLQLLVEELETLKDAKVIIEEHKKEYQQYLNDVPLFIMENDSDGFYSRLGFANINENTLTVEYKFVYTSDGGFAQRMFTVPMTEDTIIELITKLQGKLTMSAFAKEQRSLMTSKLRQHIKERDNYTCQHCGNSVAKEPNLLLEIDHITPVSKGGCTVESNLQTLCWKCNRAKSNKLI